MDETKSPPEDNAPRRWHHAPEHRFVSGQAYMVTAGTVGKALLFRGARRLSILERALFDSAEAFGWRLQAWALFPNHYHFVARAPEDATTLPRAIARIHSQSARELNRLDGAPGRKVWFEYWDSCLTIEESYFARLNYVRENAVRHGLVADAKAYPFCSARWFGENADEAFARKLRSYRWDAVEVKDDY